MRVEKAVRLLYGRFFYRFPNGESAADVYDRITGACSSSPPPPPSSPCFTIIIIIKSQSARSYSDQTDEVDTKN